MSPLLDAYAIFLANDAIELAGKEEEEVKRERETIVDLAAFQADVFDAHRRTRPFNPPRKWQGPAPKTRNGGGLRSCRIEDPVSGCLG